MAERTHSVRLRLELDQLRRDSAEASKNIGSIGSAAADAGRQSRAMETLGSAARGVGQTLAAVGTVAAGSMAALTAHTIATGLSYNTLEQSTRAALTTLLGGAEAATEQMDKLREFVRTALFPREVFITGQQQLLAFGTAAQDVIPILDAVQNAVAATGGSATIFTQVVEILAEIQSTGKITAGVLAELGRRGINAAELIGQAMGKTENEIRESITSGALDGREALELLVTAMENRFAGAAALISNTWTGALGLVTAGLRDIGSALAEPLIDPAGGGAAIAWAQSLAEVLYALERQIRDVVAEFRGSADPAFERWGDLLLDLAEQIDDFQFDLGGLIDSVRDGAPAFAALGAGISAAGGAALLKGVPGMAGLAGAISPVGAAIVAAAAASPELRAALVDLLEAVAPLVPALAEGTVALATGLSSGLGTAAAALEAVVPLVELAVDAFQLLPDGVQSATLALGAFALAAGRLPGPVGATITALGALGFVMETFGVDQVGVRTNVQNLTEDLERLQQTGRVTGEAWRLFGEDTEFFADRLDHATTLANNRLAQFSNATMKVATDLGLVQNHLQDSADRFEALDQAMAASVRSGADADELLRALADAYGLTGDQVDDLLELLPEYNREADRQAEITGENRDAQTGLASATESATAAMREQADELRAQTDPIFALQQALDEARDAQDNYNAAVEEFGAGSAEANTAALDLLAAASELSTAAGDASGSFAGKLTPAMKDALAALEANDDQIAGVKEALAILRGELDTIERTYETRIEARGAAEAEAAAKRLKRRLDEIDRQVTIHFAVTGQAPVGAARLPMQHGGPIETGPHGVDRVPAMLTRGEHVWTVREVEAAGGHANVEALRAAVLGQASRFAVGGPVGVPRMQAGGAVEAATAAGINIENLNLRAFSDRFSLAQVEAQMKMYQQAIAFNGAS